MYTVPPTLDLYRSTLQLDMMATMINTASCADNLLTPVIFCCSKMEGSNSGDEYDDQEDRLLHLEIYGRPRAIESWLCCGLSFCDVLFKPANYNCIVWILDYIVMFLLKFYSAY